MDVEMGRGGTIREDYDEEQLLQDPFAAASSSRHARVAPPDFAYVSSAAPAAASSSSSRSMNRNNSTIRQRRHASAAPSIARHTSVRLIGDRLSRVSARVAARVANVGAVETESKRPIEMIDRGDVESDGEEEDGEEEDETRLLGRRHHEQEEEDEVDDDDVNAEMTQGPDSSQGPILRGKSLGVFGPENPLRVRLFQLLQKP